MFCQHKRMRFHLDYTPPRANFNIDHRQGIFLVGSCFSEHMASRLSALRFITAANPSGILFNPLSLQQCLLHLVSGQKADDRFLLFRDGIYLSYQHHSSIHDTDRHDLLRKIDAANTTASAFLQRAGLLIVTFGSAYVYHHRQLDAAVANCHKQPAATFEKRLLTVDDIVVAYTALTDAMRKFNPGLKLIFTVSPVKYLRDGVVENNLSKSTLVLAVHRLADQIPNCFYFPAFELVNDDLRDYRFYKDDLAHPSDQAIDYVWQKFSECYFSANTQQINREIQSLNQALGHRRLIANSDEALKLNAYIQAQKEILRRMAPEIDFNH